ncbi:MAG: hypothetical protein U9N55_08550 [candidate division Zixibacteria bacterium]|nr:hypothetical protein [candidate division Zixibacteria bacterium]
MECYFGSHRLPNDNNCLDKTVVVSFNIPEIGIKFKAPFDAVDHDHGDLAALLALLEFIDSNQKYFPNQTYQIFGNNINIVNGINHRDNLPYKFAPLLEKTKGYQDRYHFSLDWIPAMGNPDFEALFD